MPTPLFLVLSLGFSLSLLAPSPSLAREGERDDAFVHVLDVEALTASELDALYSSEGVDAWVEFGNTAIVVGTEAGGASFEAAGASALARYAASADELVLARLDAAHASELLPPDALVVAGFGRYAVVLPGERALEETEVRHAESAHRLELAEVPWGEVVIRRPDRQAALVPSSAGGVGAAPGLDSGSTLVAQAVADVQSSVFTALLGDLVGFGTRYTTVSSFPNVTNWMAARFTQIGLTPQLEAFTISGKTRHNVIAELPGKATPQDVYVVCGHYDSTSQSPTTNAPGADDNASGAAGVLEMARVLSGYEFDSTIRFIGFAGEEQGLVGSNAHVSKLKAAGTLSNVKGVINMDMIAYMNTSRMDVLIEGGASTSQAMMSLLSSLVSQHTTLVPFTSTNPFGSDHMPYINNGVNAVLTIEYEDWFNPNYHRTSDTLATLTIPLAIEILKLNVAGIATAAGINGVAGGGGTAGTITTYGVGLGGANVGTLASSSVPNIGTTMTIDVSGFAGSSGVQLAMCRQQASTPAFGGTLLVDLATRITTFEQALAGGATSIAVPIPNQSGLVGLSAYLQAAALDPTQPQGLALSNGLRAQLGS